jgi:Helix-turn-helix of DDE superfamily endonuclease
MMYLRSYTTYFYLGAVFGIHESNAYRISKKVEDILIKSRIFSLPKKRELLEEELEEIIVDATEVRISRPSKKQKRKYSGKKKMHTQKAQVTIGKV